jgi:calcineurin-like phosphoesterase family protein
MRLVATSDTHHVVNPKLIPDGDVFIHAGDLMTTGYPDEWKESLEWLSQLPHKVKLFVPGNHDFHLQLYPGPALQDMRRIGFTVVGLPKNPSYYSYVLPNGMRMLGLPYVTHLPRWAFNIREVDLRQHLSNMCYEHSYEIVVSHSPMFGVLDYLPSINDNAGIHCYKDFCNGFYFNRNIKYWIHGHIHEGYGQAEFNGCKVYNVAMCNRKHEQVNPPVVIDI